jgi:hypothetical protein
MERTHGSLYTGTSSACVRDAQSCGVINPFCVPLYWLVCRALLIPWYLVPAGSYGRVRLGTSHALPLPPAGSAAYRHMPTTPTLNGTFFALQDNGGHAHVPEWSEARWNAEFSWMSKLGMNLVIFSAAVTCHSSTPACPVGMPLLSADCCFASYQSTLPELRSVGKPFLEVGMKTAAAHNFSVLIAPYLGTNFNTTSDRSVAAGANVTRAVTTDLWQAFKPYHPATLSGFYLAQECGNDPPTMWYAVTSKAAQQRWTHGFWGPTSKAVKDLSPSLEVSIAPYYFDEESAGGAYEKRGWVGLPEWTAWWDSVLPATAKYSPTGVGIDRIFYQDGRGSYSAPSHITAFQRAIGKVARTHGTEFWSDAEVWRRVNATNRTYAGADTVALQLAEQSTHVDGFVSWEWRQYLSPAGTRMAPSELSDGRLLPTNSSLSFWHDYRRVVMAHEPRLQLRSAHRPVTLSPPPLHKLPSSGRLTDGNVFSPPGAAPAEWDLTPDDTVELTVDLLHIAFPSNFRLFEALPARPPPLEADAAVPLFPHTVSVSVSHTGGGPFVPVGDLDCLADTITGMQVPWSQHTVRTFDLVVPVASISARYVRFTVTVPSAARVSIAQLEVYE